MLKRPKCTKTGLWMAPLSTPITQPVMTPLSANTLHWVKPVSNGVYRNTYGIPVLMYSKQLHVNNFTGLHTASHVQEASYSSNGTISKAESAIFHHNTLGLPLESMLFNWNHSQA